MIFKLKTLHKFFFTYICPTFYGSTPPPAPSTTTQNQNVNSIPGELMPFALGNLQAAKKQLFTTDAKGKITGYQPYTPYSTDANKYVAGFSGLQTQAQQGAANLQVPGQFTQASGIAGMSSLGALNAGNQFAQQATDPNATAAYMSPYMQDVVDYQTQQANRQYDITGAQQMGNATRAGAFGGSREAIMAAENERNRNLNITGIQKEGRQSAFQNAQAQQQFGANLGLQGYQTGIQGAQALGQLGSEQLAAETGVLATQSQYGAEQQGREQALINQNVKTWENQQNQPYRAMDVMSGLIRGTPINTSSTTQTTSVANPSYAQQVGGLLGTAGSLYGAYKGKANGGIVQAYAGGGVTETVENSIEAKLRDMSPEQLQAYIPTITSQEELSIAKMILAEETPQMAANGGIMGYADKGLVEKEPSTEAEILAWEKTHGLPFERKQSTGVGEKPIALVSEGITPVVGRGIKSIPSAKEPISEIGQKAPMSEDYDNPIYTDRKSEGIKGEAVTDIPDYALKEVGKFTNSAATEVPVVPPEEPAVAPQAVDDGLAEERATAAKTPSQIMAEREAEREKAGLRSADQISAEQRKSIMDEKSNIADESKRQMYLRMAEFFSNWGSTPGLPLVAGLKAMKDTIPGVMSDSKADHAAYAAVNKSLRDLEHATELEKAGRFDKAYEVKEQASANILKHKDKVAQWGHEQAMVDIEQKGREKIAGITQEGENVRSLLNYNKPRAGTSPAAEAERSRSNNLNAIKASLKSLGEDRDAALMISNPQEKAAALKDLNLKIEAKRTALDDMIKNKVQPIAKPTSSNLYLPKDRLAAFRASQPKG